MRTKEQIEEEKLRALLFQAIGFLEGTAIRIDDEAVKENIEKFVSDLRREAA